MYNHLLVTLDHGVGHITLNSERTLNALSQGMADELLTLLKSWERDPNVSCIFLDGAGSKAFCAGGDIKNLYHSLKEDQSSEVNPTCLKFFITEYTLDYKIHTYSKPIVSWNSGITMGGGMGLMNGASHRIVTETSLLSMPEVSIGLYPDVGATYFFNQLPSGVGKFLGVTGARFNAGDAITLGLADYFLESNLKEVLLSKLKEISWTKESSENKKLISQCLQGLSSSNLPTPFTKNLLSYFEKLSSVTELKDFETITNEFPQNEWITQSLNIYKKGSPSSAAVILRQLEQGKNLSLKEAFMSELNLSAQCSLKPDFTEGVRALLIDKDQSPQWTPATINELTSEWLDSFFKPLWAEATHPFKDW
ncbi:MAG TPA: enoyl-CoA hydratase/isomerase family protein [Bacteriovoracaceae bacterium]|nr:enoyl-CoA hydratase/isomerase family protein [Bacteriovoracaceae bacterium]